MSVPIRLRTSIPGSSASATSSPKPSAARSSEAACERDVMEQKRLTLFAGHYGSGKTNIAINYARALRAAGNEVILTDLDIVNPYFRTKDAEDTLKREGIGLIVSDYANSNVDLPSMPKEAYSLVERRDVLGVLDIGGDDRGALALGRYVPSILAEND